MLFDFGRMPTFAVAAGLVLLALLVTFLLALADELRARRYRRREQRQQQQQ